MSSINSDLFELRKTGIIQIKNFSKLNKEGEICSCFEFPSTRFLEEQWILAIYPNGISPQNQGYVSVVIFLLPMNNRLYGWCDTFDFNIFLSVIDVKGRERCCQSFAQKNLKCPLVIPTFLERCFLVTLADELLPDDTLTIQCKLFKIYYSIFANIRYDTSERRLTALEELRETFYGNSNKHGQKRIQLEMQKIYSKGTFLFICFISLNGKASLMQYLKNVLEKYDLTDEIMQTCLYSNETFRKYLVLKHKLTNIVNREERVMVESSLKLLFKHHFNEGFIVYEIFSIGNHYDPCIARIIKYLAHYESENKQISNIEENTERKKLREIGEKIKDFLLYSIKMLISCRQLHEDENATEISPVIDRKNKHFPFKTENGDGSAENQTKWNFYIETMDEVTFKIPFEDGKVTLGSKIISNSVVFDRMLQNPMRELQEKRVKLPQIDSDTFIDFLQFLQTKSIEAQEYTKLRKIYEFADQYDIPELMSLCSNKMHQIFSLSNIEETEELAYLHSDKHLMKLVESFHENITKLLQTMDEDKEVPIDEISIVSNVERSDFEFYH